MPKRVVRGVREMRSKMIDECLTWFEARSGVVMEEHDGYDFWVQVTFPNGAWQRRSYRCGLILSEDQRDSFRVRAYSKLRRWWAAREVVA